jgi:uncharacterized RDD family membrane protein YckC/cytoskeletal protein CcmA (bactofilin family)
MKSTSRALRAGFLLTALIASSAAVFAADPAKPQDNPAPPPPLHEIGSAPAAAAPTPAAAPTSVAAPTPAAEPATRRHHQDDGDNNRVSVGDATYVGPGETVDGNAVAVLGPLTVDGTVDGNAVAVLGTNVINGTVHGNAVAVLGTLRLGPNARLDGNAVAAAGRVIKEPGAIIGGNVVQQSSGIDMGDDSGASAWFHHGLRLGRVLAIGPHLHFLWIATFLQIVLYVLLAVIFPGGVTKCGETLAQRPGITLLTGFLTMVGLPVLFILLFFTIVGIPVALVVLPLGFISCTVFGKSAFYALVGRSILGKQVQPALAVILGVAIFVALYLIPFLGLAVWALVGFLGYSCAITTLFLHNRAAPKAAVPPPAPIPPTLPGALPTMAAMAATAAPQEAAVPAPQPAPAEGMPAVVAASAAHVSEVTLPRAGFWIRMVALLIDAILIGIVTHMTHFFLPVLAVYGALLWKLRGATIGGIIFGLKVVRVDGQPMEWVTVVVRALACFFSLIVVGLGFLWIAIDPEKQGWHDKIAGTVVVRYPKGVSLV